MKVWHRGQPTILGYFADGTVEFHRVLIICADIETAQAVYKTVSSVLLIDATDRFLDEAWNVILASKPIACTCTDRPHSEADGELFESLNRALARG